MDDIICPVCGVTVPVESHDVSNNSKVISTADGTYIEIAIWGTAPHACKKAGTPAFDPNGGDTRE